MNYIKRFISLLFIIFIILPAQNQAFQLKKRTPKDLPPVYRKWLEEEVVYIISAREKEVFLQLETDRERDLFIEGFWKQRDPDPSTPENEFKKEHYRRIEYANKNFGRDTPGPGWRTDMGRIYIILGEPKTIEAFENLSECYPVVVWFYDGMSRYSLPNSFYIVFFKEGGAGEYKLYSPIRYGPQYLLTHYYGDMSDYEKAYRQLYEVNPLLAEVSLNLIPGEAQVIAPSIASEVLLASRIPSVPKEMVKPTWAEKLLAYKDIIEVEYSANFIDCDSQANIIYDPSGGIYFVHYLLEPKRLTIEQSGSSYFTQLEVNGIITDEKGQTIYQYERQAPIELTAERLASIKAKLFSFQDVFPLVAGKYRFHVILKNTVSKEFTSFETEISIPEIKSPYLAPPLLAHRVERNSKYKGSVKPYLISDIQLVPSPRNDFTRSDKLFVFLQILNLTTIQRQSWWVEYIIANEKEAVLVLSKEIRSYVNWPNILEEFSLQDLPPDFYRLRVRLLNEKKEEIMARESRFYLSAATFLPRPWVMSFPYPPANDPYFSNIIGNQFLKKNNLNQAKIYLERAYSQEPAQVKYALDYAYFLLNGQEYAKAKQIALPFLATENRKNFLSLLGRACQGLEEYAEAISYYQEYLNHFGTNLPILNSLGECYYRLGNAEEAMKIWKRSLEIDPNQKDLKKLIDSIKLKDEKSP